MFLADFSGIISGKWEHTTRQATPSGGRKYRIVESQNFNESLMQYSFRAVIDCCGGFAILPLFPCRLLRTAA
ncbi:MAG: hypothetical protein RL021_1987 [Bacteroidota bacterium]|jgi:hypothetical protein